MVDALDLTEVSRTLTSTRPEVVMVMQADREGTMVGRSTAPSAGGRRNVASSPSLFHSMRRTEMDVSAARAQSDFADDLKAFSTRVINPSEFLAVLLHPIHPRASRVALETRLDDDASLGNSGTDNLVALLATVHRTAMGVLVRDGWLTPRGA